MTKYEGIEETIVALEAEVHMIPATVGTAENKALADAQVALHDAKRAIQRAKAAPLGPIIRPRLGREFLGGDR